MRHMKNLKRFVSIVLASVLVLGLAAPAFAEETTIEGAYQAVTLKVTVPQTGSAIINPYGLPIKLGEKSISGEQITTGAALLVKNQSQVALRMIPEVKVTPKGGVKIITDKTYVDTPDTVATDNVYVVQKNVCVYFEAFEAPTVTDDTETATKNNLFAALKSEDAAISKVMQEEAYEVDPDTDGELILKQGNSEGKTQRGGAAWIRLSGAVAKKPTTAWSADDGFTASIKYTFEPSEYAISVELVTDAKVDSDNSHGPTGGYYLVSGDTATVTVTLPNNVTAKVDTITWDITNASASLTITDASSTASLVKATVSNTNGGDAVQTVSVRFEGSDNNIYKGTLKIYCENV